MAEQYNDRVSRWVWTLALGLSLCVASCSSDDESTTSPDLSMTAQGGTSDTETGDTAQDVDEDVVLDMAEDVTDVSNDVAMPDGSDDTVEEITDDTSDDMDMVDDMDVDPPDLGPTNKRRVYQLTVRLFSNTNTTNMVDGDLATNGVGKFNDIDDTALDALQQMGYTDIWLHGILQQATATDYSMIGEPADDPDILKGKAGSYYAVRDYYDVCPDYAVDPSQRMAEFQALVNRIHARNMRVIIDLVPNHVARTYKTSVAGKDSFGDFDDASQFFDPQNNFFYLVDPPGRALQLPTTPGWTPPPGTDGTFEGEDNDGMPPGDIPRVTGNNVLEPSPTSNDWYETVKLNYGFNFAVPAEQRYDPIPRTWTMMDDVIGYWQNLGVDGFRTDFTHYVPMEFWTWAIAQARMRDPDVFFVAEAYNTIDGVPGFSFENLVNAGFDSVYDDESYDLIKRIYCCGAWANDLNNQILNLPPNQVHTVLRYAENHDERRIASPVVQGGNPDASGFGDPAVGRAVTSLLFLLGQGPVMIYNGQEVGEPATGREGFGGDDGRTSIFDYWAMPEFAKWVNGGAYDGGQLSQDQLDLRAYYTDLLALTQQPAISHGEYFGVQYVNNQDMAYCNMGQWCFSFLRYNLETGQRWLVVVNLSPTDIYAPFVRVPAEGLEAMGITEMTGTVSFTDRLGVARPMPVTLPNLVSNGVALSLAPLQTVVLDMTVE